MTASAGIVAKFSTVAGGCWIEDAPLSNSGERTGHERCWRFDREGRAEWLYLRDAKDPSPRWFGHQYKASDFILA